MASQKLPLIFAGILLMAPPAHAQSAPPPDVVTGGWSLELPEGRGCSMDAAPVSPDSIRVQLMCLAGGRSVNYGALDEVVPVRNSVATYKASFGDSSCTITFDFRKDELRVSEQGICATVVFGKGVSAEGSYKRWKNTAEFDMM